MKHRITQVAAIVMTLSLPVSAHANEPAAASQPMQQKAVDKMSCPMMGDMGAMQKNIGSMMGDMDSMMKMMSDPAMKERMQKMHENMAVMMQQMTDMHKGMGGMMMQGRKMDSKAINDAPAAAVTPEDHKAHHPDKQ